jgi:uncharacterized protein
VHPRFSFPCRTSQPRRSVRRVRGEESRKWRAVNGLHVPAPRSRLNAAVVVRASTIEGCGLFATEAIAKGDIVAVMGGQVMTDKEFEHYVAHRRKWSAMAIGNGTHLVQELDDPAAAGNHSCDPNAWLIDAVTVAARRAIEADEEITTDYATHTVDPSWQMTCNCGTSECRGVVRGDDWRRPELQVRYHGHFSPAVQARFD